MIYIFTNKAAPLKKIFPKDASFVSTPLSKHTALGGDITYIDVTGLAEADLKKTLAQAKKSLNGRAWGIIDAKGSVSDVARLFFDGASDYLGPNFFKEAKAPDAKRFKDVLRWRKISAEEEKSGSGERQALSGGDFINSGVKLPAANAFPGWKKLQVGKVMPFFLLFCSIQGKTALDTRIGDKVLALVYKKFSALLANNLKEAQALLWMNTGKDCLFLIPPKATCAQAAIKACIGMIVSSPLHALETLGVNVPMNFIFALHYGMITYKPPGKTGTIVSDAVNSIFHLGAKKSEPGRLTISGEIPDVSIPKNMQDLFVPSGEYEGRKIWHTKKFTYPKAWY